LADVTSSGGGTNDLGEAVTLCLTNPLTKAAGAGTVFFDVGSGTHSEIGILSLLATLPAATFSYVPKR
jgi:hypothetical protein